MLKVKKLFTFSFLLVTIWNTSFSQNYKLHGLTSLGGSNGGGNIYSMDLDGNNYREKYSFSYPASSSGQTSGIVEVDGFYYTTTIFGGSYGKGTILKIDQNDETVLVLHNFDGLTGERPDGTFQIGNDGYLYGTTITGGSFGLGTIYRINQISTDFELLFEFDGTNGFAPRNVTIASDGMLYGTASGGGEFDSGVLFKMNLDGTSYSILTSFRSEIGSSPIGGVIEATNGVLYGATQLDGEKYGGTIFSFDINDDDFQVIHHFDRTDISFVRGRLTQATDGLLYGMSRRGGEGQQGTIFKIDLDGSDFEILYEFNSNGGGTPLGGELTESSDGLLLGLTNNGGENDVGYIFKIEKGGSGFEAIYDFDEDHENSPYGNILINSENKLMGLANNGLYYRGAIFKLNMDGTEYQTIHSLGSSNGVEPEGNIVTDHRGNIYGTMSYGGTSSSSTGTGVLFKLDIHNYDYTK